VKYPEYTGEEPCASVGVEMFYKPGDNPSPWPDIPALRRVCANCDMLVACRTWAIHHESEANGFWGGMTGSERRAERKRLNIPLRDPVNIVVGEARRAS
jgi:WhiB family redox-sensing transcriptional regulator